MRSVDGDGVVCAGGVEGDRATASPHRRATDAPERYAHRFRIAVGQPPYATDITSTVDFPRR